METPKIETLERSALGNTESNAVTKKCSKQVPQRVHWIFTWNNYVSEDIETLESHLKEYCYMYAFQEEIGHDKHTPHIQGVISLKKKGRYTEFNLNKKIHWEKVNNLTKSYEYCTKDDTRKPNTNPYCFNYVVKKKLKIIENLNDWQSIIYRMITLFEPNDRTVIWCYSEKGCVGKSAFCKYLIYKHNALFIDEGKKCDIMNSCMKFDFNKSNIVCIDVPRDNITMDGKPAVSYKSIESIKNGMIYSGKYEGGYKLFNAPHIVVFSNLYPDISKLSKDRWCIFNVETLKIETVDF